MRCGSGPWRHCCIDTPASVYRNGDSQRNGEIRLSNNIWPIRPDVSGSDRPGADLLISLKQPVTIWQCLSLFL